MATRSTRRPRRYENWLVAMLFATVGCIFLDRFAVQYLSPLFVKEFKMTQAEVGAVVGFLSIGWAISSWAFGSLSDRKGRRAVLIPAVAVFSLLSVITGLVQSFVQMLVARLLMGVAEGAALTPAYAVMAEESAAHRRGVNLGIMQSSISLIGIAITPVIVTIVGSAFGWRWGFALVAIPGLIMTAILFRFLREPQARLHEEKAGLLSVFGYRNVRLSIANGFLFGAWTVCLYGFLPLYLTGPAYNLPLTTMGAFLGAGGLVAFLGQIVIPFISDRIGRKPMVIISGLLVAGIAWAAPIGLTFPLMAAAFLICNVGQGGIPIAIAVIPTETAPRVVAATAVGVTVFAVEIAAFMSGVIVGALADATNNHALPLVIAGGAAFLVAIISLFYRETAPSRVSVSAPEPEAARASA